MSCASCEQEPCRCPGQFTVLDQVSAGRTLLRSLVPCVDQIRDLYTQFGARSYQVAMVRTKWSGGERGMGHESVLSEELVLPTPLVAALSGVDRTAQQFGLAETGSVQVSQISARYTEDQLVGLGAGGERIPEDESFYWEVRAIVSDGTVARRRFFPQSVPSLDMLKLEWTVTLTKAGEDRGRSGGTR